MLGAFQRLNSLGMQRLNGMGAGLGRALAVIKWLFNGLSTPDSYTGGPLYVEDNTGTLVTGGADVVTIPGARLSGGAFVPTDSEGAPLFTPQTLDGFVDYSIDPTYQGMMVMPAGAPLLTYSNKPSDASWFKGGNVASAPPVLVDNSTDVLDPKGGNTATKITFDATAASPDYSIIGKLNSLATSTTYTASVWLRTLTGTADVYLFSTNDLGSWFTTLLNVTSTWQRFEFTFTTGAGIYHWLLGHDLADPTQTAKPVQTVYFYEGQAEVGAFATTLMPTEATLDVRSATVAAFDTADRLRANDWAATGIVTPWAGGQGSQYPLLFGTHVNGPNFVDTIFFPDNTLKFRKTIASITSEVSLAYTHAKDTPFQWMVYQHSTHGIGLMVREYTGGAWQAWSSWAVNADTTDALIASTLQIGARNGAGQFAGTYPVTATTFLNQSFATVGDLQTYLATNAKWTLIGG